MEIANVRTDMSREGLNGLAAQQVDQGARLKARIRPVEEGAEMARNALDEKRLRREEDRVRKQLSDAEMQEVLKEVQDRLDMMGTNLQFAMDKVAEEIVVKVTDKQSGELIRQIPSEDMIKLRKKLEELTGLLFEGTA
jgi:flagellar protein FlaG